MSINIQWGQKLYDDKLPTRKNPKMNNYFEKSHWETQAAHNMISEMDKTHCVILPKSIYSLSSQLHFLMALSYSRWLNNRNIISNKKKHMIKMWFQIWINPIVLVYHSGVNFLSLLSFHFLKKHSCMQDGQRARTPDETKTNKQWKYDSRNGLNPLCYTAQEYISSLFSSQHSIYNRTVKS